MKFNVPLTEFLVVLQACREEWDKANLMSSEGGYYSFSLELADFYAYHKNLLTLEHPDNITVSLCKDEYTNFTLVLTSLNRRNNHGKT